MKQKDYPVYKGQVLEVTVTGYTSEGMGVAKVDGLAVFIHNAIEGEQLKIKIAQAQKEIELYISKMSQANETVLRYINEKIADLDAKKEVWERELGQLEDQKRSTTLNLDEISDCMNYWEMLSNPDKLKIVDAFILSISASKEGVPIQWKL